MPLEPYQRHLLIIEDDKGSRPLTLEQGEYSIGRDRECDIRLASLFVSRHHATLMRVPLDEGTYGYCIVDGKPNGQRSANGLLINGTKLKAHNLEDEDEVVFGPQVRFTYHLLKRDPDITEPLDDLDPITLINPRTAGQEYARETASDFLKFSWNKPSRQFNLTGQRRLLNPKFRGNLKPKRKMAK
ncbi:FHA domain-containing protein [Kovacikia minuta]|uniref:FHA domain-containing protein n=1 Tax=Kovacikia minuta TaxID=2931930 RepID=UPI0026744DC3|nr:FHA domain-containing protein [Kovacikia minuta]